MRAIIALTTLSLALTACGDKSGDPMKGYEDLNNRVPVNKKDIRQQSHAICGSKVSAEKVIVVEGQTASAKLTVRGPNAGRVSSFVIAEPVSGASLQKVKQTKIQEDKKETANVDETLFEQEYKLVMKASRGTVAFGESSKIIKSSVVPQAQLNSAVSCTSPIEIEVQKIKGIPAIKSVNAPKTLKYEAIGDVEIVINVEAQEVTKVEDLTLAIGFDQTRQSTENVLNNLKDFGLDKSATLPVAANSYQYKIKVSGEALKAAVDKQSDQLKKSGKTRMFIDFHSTFQVSNSHTKEKSLVHDYILRIDRKPFEAAPPVAAKPVPAAQPAPTAKASPAPASTVKPTGDKK